MPEDGDGEWRTLTGADELVEFYDPTDVFGDLADALAEAFPAVAPEERRGRPRRTGDGGRRPDADRRGRRGPDAEAAEARRRPPTTPGTTPTA